MGGYIGTIGDGTTYDIIKTYVEKQEKKEKKKHINKWKYSIFNTYLTEHWARNIPRCL
jgi:hypothetical protein